MATLIPKPTPQDIDNRAALDAIRRRIGTHGAFRAAMIRGLRSRHRPGLAELRTQSDEDFTIALIDAWAAVLDNLSFYSERINNEAYLPTATETFSVEALAALVGYRLSPAVAAEAWMAFTADTSVLEDGVTELPTGLGLKSVPEEGELPQNFETVEPLRLKSTWNDIRPLTRWPQHLDGVDAGFYTDLRQTPLKVGDRLGYINSNGWLYFKAPVAPESQWRYLRPVAGIEPISDDFAWITTEPDATPSPMPSLSAVLQPEAADTAKLEPASLETLLSETATKQWPRSEVLNATAALDLSPANLAKARAAAPLVIDTWRPVVFREKCRFFGHNATTPPTLKSNDAADAMPYEPVTFTAPGLLYYQSNAITDDAMRSAEAPADGEMSLFLDRKYDSLAPGSLVVLRGRRLLGGSLTAVQEQQWRISSVETVTIEAFGLTGEVSRIRVPTAWWYNSIWDIQLRTAELYIADEAVPMPDLPLLEAVEGDELVLDLPDYDLAPGQSLMLSGERADMPGVSVSERAEIAEVWANDTNIRLVLETPLAHRYLRETVHLNGNIARATHGETVHEILGSGDGRVAFQRFTLKAGPLTYVSADTPTGRRAELEVRVDGVRWHEVATLDQAGSDDRAYVVLTGQDGKTEIMFGGAGMGARLSTGENNVEATYRKGAGAEGRLKAQQITLLAAKPRSIKAVTNPLAPTGGASGERREDARANASSNMLTLGRIVSLKDYEDFATSFAGITKARAAWSWVGEDQHVFLTVAGEDATPLLTTDSVIENLTAVILDVSAPGTGVTVRPARVALFTLSVRLIIDPDFRTSEGAADPVITAARQTLRAHFDFAHRRIGQPVRGSEIITLLQSVAGVKAVDLDALHRVDAAPGLPAILRADVPRTAQYGALQGAEILLMGSDPVTLEAL